MMVGGCLALLVACAAAQASAATTAASTDQQAAAAAAPAKPHHAKKQHAKKHQASHAGRETPSIAAAHETAYQTALRRCVQGQGQQRDQCLDDAIARYGRS